MFSTHDKLKSKNFLSQKNWLSFDERDEIDFAIIAAMPEELDFFKKRFSPLKRNKIIINKFEFVVYEYKNANILVACTGLGTTFAASILTLINAKFKPNYILLCGTAGGIDPNLKIRDVVIAEQAFEAEIQGAFTLLKDTPFEGCLKHPLKNEYFPSSYPASIELLDLINGLNFKNIKIHKGSVVSSNAFPAPKELFDQIKTLNPYSIDMETSALYQIGWLFDLKVLAIRGISNVLNQEGDDENVNVSDITGSSEAAGMVLIEIINKLLAKRHTKMKNNMEDDKAIELIKRFNLEPHPEGGYFARVYSSSDIIMPTNPRYNGETRQAASSIYYLLKNNDYSSWHRLKSDELWHFYQGSPLNIYVIEETGKLTKHVLGNPLEIENASFQVVIKAGNWFAAENVHKTSYCLIGCTVSPAFEFKDFELAKEDLLNKFPQHGVIISQFLKRAPEKNNIMEPFAL